MALPDGPLRRLSLDGLLMNGLPMNGLLLKALTMKNHRLVIAALCLTPLLAACELVVDFDRTRIAAPGDSGADMSASDMNPPPTDMPVADMPGADLNVADMDIPDMPGADLNVADLGVTDLGTDDLGVADLGVADLGVADLGVADLGQDLGPMDAGPPACPTTCNDLNPCTDDSCVVATGLCAHVPNTDPCSDGNACTMSDICAATVCAGTVVDCSAMNGDCVVGMCNTTTGACVMMDRPNGTVCMTTMMCMSGACVP